MLEITPSAMGLPTIYDQDFLIYAISQVTACLNRGETPHRHLILYGGDMLDFANRTRSGKVYNSLEGRIRPSEWLFDQDQTPHRQRLQHGDPWISSKAPGRSADTMMLAGCSMSRLPSPNGCGVPSRPARC